MVKENRKQGAIRAAHTRKNKKSKESAQSNCSTDSVYYCGMCNVQYVEFTEEVEKWICCEGCETWYYFVCVGVDNDKIPQDFVCEQA